jgi:hypothetical protein
MDNVQKPSDSYSYSYLLTLQSCYSLVLLHHFNSKLFSSFLTFKVTPRPTLRPGGPGITLCLAPTAPARVALWTLWGANLLHTIRPQTSKMPLKLMYPKLLMAGNQGMHKVFWWVNLLELVILRQVKAKL